MRCGVCGRRAVLSDPPLCREHVVSHVRKKAEGVLSRIKGYGEKRFLVAVSGGKDSAALARVFADLGLNHELLFVDLGIPGYSGPSLDAARDLAALLGSRLNVVRVEDFGFSMAGVRQAVESGRIREKVCSVCGTVKRYLFNRFAVEKGFDYVATAHNLDDASALVAMGISSGGLYPVEAVSHPGNGMAGRVKPFLHVSEKELLVFTLLEKLPVHHAECPFSSGNTQIMVKRALSGLSEVLPGFRRGLVRRFRASRPERELHLCSSCGFPTSAGSGVCKFCRISNFFNKSSGRT